MPLVSPLANVPLYVWLANGPLVIPLSNVLLHIELANGPLILPFSNVLLHIELAIGILIDQLVLFSIGLVGSFFIGLMPESFSINDPFMLHQDNKTIIYYCYLIQLKSYDSHSIWLPVYHLFNILNISTYISILVCTNQIQKIILNNVYIYAQDW